MNEILKFETTIDFSITNELNDILVLIDGMNKTGKDYPFPDKINYFTAMFFKSLYETTVDVNNKKQNKFFNNINSKLNFDKNWLFLNNHEMTFIIKPEYASLNAKLYGLRRNVPIEEGYGSSLMTDNDIQNELNFPLNNSLMNIHTHPLSQVASIQFSLKGNWTLNGNPIASWLINAINIEDWLNRNVIDSIIKKQSTMFSIGMRDVNGKIINGSYVIENANFIKLRNQFYNLAVTKQSVLLQYNNNNYNIAENNEYNNVIKKLQSIPIKDINGETFYITSVDLEEIFDGNGIYTVEADITTNQNNEDITTITINCYFHESYDYFPSGYRADLYPRGYWNWLLLKDYLIAYRSTEKGVGDVQAVYDLNSGANIGVDIGGHRNWMDTAEPIVPQQASIDMNAFISWKTNHPTYVIESYNNTPEDNETGRIYSFFNMYGRRINNEKQVYTRIKTDEPNNGIYNIEGRKDGTIKMEIFDIYLESLEAKESIPTSSNIIPKNF